MSLTDRDRKILFALIPIVAVLAYWFLVLAPKRSEAESLGTQLEKVEAARDDAVSRAAQLEGSRQSYATDYATVVRLGKAIPASVDMPSLLVQLDEAARGTRIRFGRVTAGARVSSTATPPSTPSTGVTTPPAAPASAGTAPPAAPAGAAAPGGAPAQSAPGAPAETAGAAVQDANQTSAAPSGDPAAAPAASDPATGAPTAAPALDSVPLTFEFSGGFFDLADFFHEMKRFVHVANGRVRVEGRLMTIDGFKFDSTSFPTIKAEVQATVYLSPQSQGVTAGASPAGPPAGAAVPTGQSVPEPASPASPGAAAAPQSVGVQ